MGASAFVSVIFILLLVYYSFENKINSYIINKQIIIQLFSYILIGISYMNLDYYKIY